MTHKWCCNPEKKKLTRSYYNPKLPIRATSIKRLAFHCLQDGHCGQVHPLFRYMFREFYPKPKVLVHTISAPKYEFKHLRRFPNNIQAMMAKIKLQNKPNGLVARLQALKLILRKKLNLKIFQLKQASITHA